MSPHFHNAKPHQNPCRKGVQGAYYENRGWVVSVKGVQCKYADRHPQWGHASKSASHKELLRQRYSIIIAMFFHFEPVVFCGLGKNVPVVLCSLNIFGRRGADCCDTTSKSNALEHLVEHDHYG